MLFPIAFATVWGATIVPLVMLVSLAFERLQAARRLARLDHDVPYETRLQAEHEARQSRNVPIRHIEWRDFASPRAVVPATLATLLALTTAAGRGMVRFRTAYRRNRVRYLVVALAKIGCEVWLCLCEFDLVLTCDSLDRDDARNRRRISGR